jgi:hypothetical protein
VAKCGIDSPATSCKGGLSLWLAPITELVIRSSTIELPQLLLSPVIAEW